MRLTDLSARDFRCFEQLVMCPGSGMNIITGDNASGKTSILEAVFMLGRGQSFRGSAPGPVTRKGGAALVLGACIEDDRGLSHRIGMTQSGGTLAYKLDNNSATRRFDLITALPLQLIDANLHRLLDQGPRFRRHFLDWGVFHVEHRFFPAWRQYRRALRQRNRALRDKQSAAAISAWDHELIQAAATIDDCRHRYVVRLTSTLPDAVVRLLGADAPTISYYSGWRQDIDFAAALESSLERDRRAGYTHVGPHRADLKVEAGGVRARAHVSRGQQKMLAATLLLTQARIVQRQQGVTPVLLVDDPEAELGSRYLRALLHEIQTLGGQCFASFLDTANLPDLAGPVCMFHVEHGNVVAG